LDDAGRRLKEMGLGMGNARGDGLQNIDSLLQLTLVSLGPMSGYWRRRRGERKGLRMALRKKREM